MPRIKIQEKTLKGYTGNIGGIDFQYGVSVDSVSRRDADRLGSCFQVTDIDTGALCNAAATLDENLRPKSEAVEASVVGEVSDESVVEDSGEAPEVEASEEVAKYTEAELQVIADEKGIEGLRQVAEPFGIKANSIVKLIKAILAAQG